MAQYIPGESFGGRLGTALGTGIGSGLQNLAQQKVEELSQRRLQAQRGEFWEQLGLPPSVGSLDPGVQKALLDRLEGIGLPQQPNGLQAIQGMVPQEQQQTTEVPQTQQSSGIRLGASPTERRHRENLEVNKEKNEQKRIENAFRATKETRKEILTDKRTAQKDLDELDFQSGLNESGKLVSPAYYSALKAAHLDIPALLQSPESEAYIASTKNFISNARQIFGGRVTNFELDQFLKTIPTLENTKEGRKIILSKMKNVAQAKVQRYKAYEEVLRESKGVPPLDLDEQIERKLDKKLDKFSKKFTQGLQKQQEYGGLSVVKEQNTAPTEEGIQFINPVGEHMIIKNGKAVPFGV